MGWTESSEAISSFACIIAHESISRRSYRPPKQARAAIGRLLRQLDDVTELCAMDDRKTRETEQPMATCSPAPPSTICDSAIALIVFHFRHMIKVQNRRDKAHSYTLSPFLGVRAGVTVRRCSILVHAHGTATKHRGSFWCRFWAAGHRKKNNWIVEHRAKRKRAIRLYQLTGKIARNRSNWL